MTTRRAHELASDAAPFRYYMGWDSHEIIAHEVAKFSCLARASVPVRVHALQQAVLRERGLYRRARDAKQNTEFTYLRFLVPHLAGYTGWALFTDDDFLWLGDIADLLDLADDRFAVLCVKHAPTLSCGADHKLAGVPQEMYPRKNWSSVMLINCAHPATRKLTPELVASASPQFLHRLHWAVPDGAPLDDESLIGELPFAYNWLVDWYPASVADQAKLVHFTDGGPWYPDYRNRRNADGTVGVHHQQAWIDACARYEATLPTTRELCPYERFSALTPKAPILPGYPNSDAGYWEWTNEDEWQQHVRDVILKDELLAAVNGK
jgi:lipopolysaccharide biosynthesis glycosyltransferase